MQNNLLLQSFRNQFAELRKDNKIILAALSAGFTWSNVSLKWADNSE